MAVPAENITLLLAAVERGERGALDAAFQQVYARLKDLAHAQLRRVPDATLSTTALVHEVYLKFAGADALTAHSREHFYNLSARAMRQILLDRARSVAARKRVGAAVRVTLGDPTAVVGPDGSISPASHDASAALHVGALSAELLDLDHALNALAELDASLGQLVELRLFAGLEFAEIAELRAVSERTVLRDWRKARALLAAHLEFTPPA